MPVTEGKRDEPRTDVGRLRLPPDVVMSPDEAEIVGVPADLFRTARGSTSCQTVSLLRTLLAPRSWAM